MTCEKTKLKGVYIVHFEPKNDERGYFIRTFCHKEFAKAGIRFSIVQTNRSLTRFRGAIRGMHYQKQPFAENKLIQCIRGSVFDVVLDIRNHSKTFRQWISVELSQDNNRALFIPKGYAHGFQTLQSNCEVEYFMSEYYSPTYATGVRCTDPFFGITWPLPITFASKKDTQWPLVDRKKIV